MGLLRRQVVIPEPNVSKLPLPDAKWCRKNFRDVVAMRQFALDDVPSRHEDAAPLATSLAARWPSRNVPSDVAAGLLHSVALGLAFGRLDGRPEMPREAWEAMCYSAGLDTPRNPPLVVAAFFYGVFAGNYLWRQGVDEVRLAVGFDWQEVYEVSSRAGVVQEMLHAGWDATADEVGPIR